MAKILIIDDDGQICRVISDFLRRQGHEAAIALTGEEGLALATKMNPDLFVCDLEMPGLSGEEVVAMLRRDERWLETPVIYLSGCTDRSQIRRSMNIGGDDFIAKPAQLPEILEAINARLARREQRQERLDQQIEKAAEFFVGIIHDLNKTTPEVRWLADTVSGMAGQKNLIVEKVRQSLEAGQRPAGNVKTVPPTSILLKSNNRQQFLKLSAVKALMAYGEYSNVYWDKDQRMMFRKPLKQWEEELPAEQFVRIHRQAIINLAFLDFVEKDAAGRLNVHLKEFDQTLAVSQRETAAFNRRLKEFQAGA